MKVSMLRKVILGVTFGVLSGALHAVSIEGYWKSSDDRTGEPLSLIKIAKEANGTYSGEIVHRYPNAAGHVLNTCSKCPPPYKDKPLVGLKILTGFKDEPNKPGHYIDGTVLDAKSGGVYKGKAQVSANNRQLRMRGYVGVSVFGRTNVWIRQNDGTP